MLLLIGLGDDIDGSVVVYINTVSGRQDMEGRDHRPSADKRPPRDDLQADDPAEWRGWGILVDPVCRTVGGRAVWITRQHQLLAILYHDGEHGRVFDNKERHKCEDESPPGAAKR